MVVTASKVRQTLLLFLILVPVRLNMWKASLVHLRDKAQALLQASRSIKVSQYSCVSCCRPARHTNCTLGRY